MQCNKKMYVHNQLVFKTFEKKKMFLDENKRALMAKGERLET